MYLYLVENPGDAQRLNLADLMMMLITDHCLFWMKIIILAPIGGRGVIQNNFKVFIIV